MDITWIDAVANGGLFGVIAALLYLIFIRDKEMSELRSAVADLSAAITVLSELVRFNENYEKSAAGILLRVEDSISATNKETALIREALNNLSKDLRAEMQRGHVELMKDIVAEMKK